jgi:hypothetical protein
LFSTQQSQSPLAPKSHVSFKVCTQLRTQFFIFRSGLAVTSVARIFCNFRDGFNASGNSFVYVFIAFRFSCVSMCLYYPCLDGNIRHIY